jgi:hypothetical protein
MCDDRRERDSHIETIAGRVVEETPALLGSLVGRIFDGV